jgi:hypothetical protein
MEEVFMLAVPKNDDGADAKRRVSAVAIEELRLFLSRPPYNRGREHLECAGARRARWRMM